MNSKIPLSLFCFLLVFLFQSCEKEDEINPVTIEENSTSKFKKFNDKLVSRKAQTCSVTKGEETKYGVWCKAVNVGHCSGSANTCYIDGNGIINALFSTQQLAAWGTDGMVLEENEEFVIMYYDFYMHMYEQGIMLHPDSLIAIYNGQ